MNRFVTKYTLFKDNIDGQRHLNELKMELELLNKELETIVANYDPSYSSKITWKKFPNIFEIYEKHNGLCDLMCNYYTIKKMRGDAFSLDDFIKNGEFSLEKMENLSKTHVLSLSAFLDYIKFIFFGSIPCNIFTNEEQKQIRKGDGNLNEVLLSNRLDKIEIGSCIKFSTFELNQFRKPVTGHSMLITKLDEDKYMFFNPDRNSPSCSFFDKENLIDHLNKVFPKNAELAFIDNDELMKRVDKNLIDKIIDKELEGNKLSLLDQEKEGYTDNLLNSFTNFAMDKMNQLKLEGLLGDIPVSIDVKKIERLNLIKHFKNNLMSGNLTVKDLMELSDEKLHLLQHNSAVKRLFEDNLITSEEFKSMPNNFFDKVNIFPIISLIKNGTLSLTDLIGLPIEKCSLLTSSYEVQTLLEKNKITLDEFKTVPIAVFELIQREYEVFDAIVKNQMTLESLNDLMEQEASSQNLGYQK